MNNFLMFFLLMLSVPVMSETYTQAKEISEIELTEYRTTIEGIKPGITYLGIYSSTGSWEPLGCGQQSIVSIKSNEIIGYEQFLSMALAAKMGQRKVAFSGECIDDRTFKATKIKIF